MAKGRGRERFTGRGTEAPEWVKVTQSGKVGRGQEASGATQGTNLTDKGFVYRRGAGYVPGRSEGLLSGAARRLAQLIPSARGYREAPPVQRRAQADESHPVLPATNRLVAERPAAPQTSNNSTERQKAATGRTWSDVYSDEHILQTAKRIAAAWSIRTPHDPGPLDF